MQATKTLTIIVGLGIIGFIGYFFYSSYNSLENRDEIYEANMFEPYGEMDDFDEEYFLLESDLNYLEEMEFDGSEENTLESEQAFESEISTQEEQEDSFDNEIDELESMDF